MESVPFQVKSLFSLCSVNTYGPLSVNWIYKSIGSESFQLVHLADLARHHWITHLDLSLQRMWSWLWQEWAEWSEQNKIFFKATFDTYEIFVSVGGFIHQAQFFMDKVLNDTRADLCKGDASSDEDNSNGCNGTPDHRATLHGDQDCVRVGSVA